MDKRTLYKLTSIGKTQVWNIWTEGPDICTEYGQLDGKKITTRDTIRSGKGIGTIAETTPEEQAEKEAISKWEKKSNKDYRESLDEIGKLGDVKEASLGGYLPMLAKKYTIGSMVFPCYVQPKLDGLRCIARKENDVVTLWFRSGKQITTMVHIENELNTIMDNGDIFDGELYSDKIDFNKICGAIRRDKNIKDNVAQQIDYYVYDAPRIHEQGLLYDEGYSFDVRLPILHLKASAYGGNIIPLLTEYVDCDQDVVVKHDEYVAQGFEGIMLRDPKMCYEQKRSKYLLKHKVFNEDEFQIVAYEEGRGRLQGRVGAFVCEMSNGNRFKAKLKGKGVTDLLKDYFDEPEIFMNKMLTVKYQGLSADGIPRFPVGKVVRFDA